MNSVKFCSQCGNKLSEHDKFCGSCGCKILSMEPVNESSNEVTTNEIKAESEMLVVSNKEGILKQYLSFQGRVSKRDYIIRLWNLFVMECMIGLIVLNLMLDSFLKAENMNSFMNDIIVLMVICFGMAIPYFISSISLQIRRCHDLDKSGWHLLSPFYMLKLLFTKGTVGNNQYGFDPIERSGIHKKNDVIKGHEAIIGIFSILICFGSVYWSIASFLSQPMFQQPSKISISHSDYNTMESPRKNETIVQNKSFSNHDNKIQEIFQTRNIKGEVLATSYGHNEKGFISILQRDGQYGFYILNSVDHQIAFVPFSQSLYHFYEKKERKSYNPSFAFNITIFDDKVDRDKNAGAWEKNNHIIPVYIDFEIDAKGNIIPGMINTAESLNPSHYHDVLYEQKNVNTINLLLTEMKSLKANAGENNITLPNI